MRHTTNYFLVGQYFNNTLKNTRLIPFVWVMAVFVLPMQLPQAWAQGKPDDIARADQFFASYQFDRALDIYKSYWEAQPSDSIAARIGETYFKLGENERAVEWFSKSANFAKPVHELHYAMALSAQKRYEESKQHYLLYRNRLSKSDDQEEVLKAIEGVGALLEKSPSVEVELSPVSTSRTEFNPVLYKNQLIFVSSKSDSKGRAISDETELYSIEVDTTNKISGAPTLMSKEINSKLNEGPAVFTQDGNTMFFTRNNAKSSSKLNRLAIFQATLMNENWTNIISLPLNNENYSVGHPAITSDGKTLIFASDKPGGLGGTDLYQSERVDNKWSEPVNLGNKINTDGNEMFPLITDENTLYFASNKLGGLGGFDVYKTNLADPSVIQNMGAPVNSSADDFGITFWPDKRAGYFSSNRPGGPGKDDIYSFTLEEIVLIKGVVVDSATNSPLSSVDVTLADEAGAVTRLRTDKEGKFSVELVKSPSASLTFSCEGYFEQRQKIDFSGLVADRRVSLRNTANYHGRLTDADGQGIEGATVMFTDIVTKKERSTTTDPEGNYFIEIEPGHYYEVILSKPSLFKITEVLITDESRITRGAGETRLAGITSAKAADPKPAEPALEKVVNVDLIYFDFGEAVLRDEARSELDRIRLLLQENPGINVELQAHTDPVGGKYYNSNLSRLRAQSAIDYLVRKGVDKSRLMGKAFGESRILKDCGDERACNHNNRRIHFELKESLSHPGEVETVVGSDAFEAYLREWGTRQVEGLEYRISIGAFAIDSPKDFSRLNDLGAIVSEKRGLFTQYFLTGFATLHQAEAVRQALKDRGIPDAYAVPLYNGKPIARSELNTLDLHNPHRP